MPTQNTGTIGGFQDFHLPDLPFNFLSLYLFKEFALLNISKEKVDADSPCVSPCSCNLTSKRRR
jgi:hypothetical protein